MKSEAPCVFEVPSRRLSDSQAPAPGGSKALTGVVFAMLAYLAWGVLPFYFKAASEVPPVEMLAHRILWSFVLLAILLPLLGRWRATVDAIRTPRTHRMLLASSLMIGTSWFTFIWGATHGLVLQLSLAYFICPLISVALGFAFLRERLTRRQAISVFLAAAGVAYLTIAQRELPTLALVHAGSFGAYGLLRKVAKVDPISGMGIELALLLPAAILYLAWLAWNNRLSFGATSWQLDALLVCTGFVTAVPLIWFVCAAKRLRLITLGLLQYTTPSIHFILAIAVFGELFTRTHLITFGCIWMGLAIYSLDTVGALRGNACRINVQKPDHVPEHDESRALGGT